VGLPRMPRAFGLRSRPVHWDHLSPQLEGGRKPQRVLSYKTAAEWWQESCCAACRSCRSAWFRSYRTTAFFKRWGCTDLVLAA